MSDFIAISTGNDTAVSHTEAAHRATVRRTADDASGVAAARSTDRVELSDHARFLARLKDLPVVRADLVQQVRARIEAGAYDGEDVVEKSLDRIVEDLDSIF